MVKFYSKKRKIKFLKQAYILFKKIFKKRINFVGVILYMSSIRLHTYDKEGTIKRFFEREWLLCPQNLGLVS